MKGIFSVSQEGVTYETPCLLINCKEFRESDPATRREELAELLQSLSERKAEGTDLKVYSFPLHIEKCEKQIMERLEYLCKNVSDDYQICAGYSRNFKNDTLCPQISVINDNVYGGFVGYPVLTTSDTDGKIHASVSKNPKKEKSQEDFER